jgi:hypothetical protein
MSDAQAFFDALELYAGIAWCAALALITVVAFVVQRDRDRSAKKTGEGF